MIRARCGRNAGDITLVAVTKTVGPERINEAIAAGVRTIGENRVQEAKAKKPLVTGNVTWHMIGHLQTNKVNDALTVFNVIQSIDSLRLARAVNDRTEKTVTCLIEVNTSGEETKFGVAPAALPDLFRAARELGRLDIQGLMTIGPGLAVSDPEASRPCFARLRELRDDLEARFRVSLPVLSMGMSADSLVAVEMGSTMVRIGTAVFGPR